MSEPIKLIYFNVIALGEPLRFILHYSGLKFIDERLKSYDEFLALQEGFPFGKVPVLEIDGKKIHQTKAMCRYFAKKVGLLGKSEWDQLECDIMVDTIDDFRAALAAYYYERHAGAKEQKKELLLTKTVPYYVGKFETHLANNQGHFVNGQLTWADFYFSAMVEYFNLMAGKELFTDSPGLNALKEKIIGLPGIKEYIAQRPPPKKLCQPWTKI